ncbi:2-C-methyl-D-erythritol 4-phosphate cytidylyltransferase [Candidatus Omnitrophota bacterium]
MKTSVILPAAGLGLRIKSDIAKPLILINDESIIIHTLKNLDSHPLINEIVLVFNSKDMTEIKKLIIQKGIKKVTQVVEGGAIRKESVKNGLRHISADTDIVLIHDGVRPFIDHKVVTEAIEAAVKSGAAIVGVPVKATLKKVKLEDQEVESTLNRDEVWEIQTPQVFRKDLIMEAYKDSDGIEASDDSCLVERLGQRVTLVKGSYFNIKITTPEDLVLAQAISKNSR